MRFTDIVAPALLLSAIFTSFCTKSKRKRLVFSDIIKLGEQ